MECWENWFQDFGPALQLYARQLTGSAADAEDAVQEAFASCVRTRPAADDPRAFLFTCVRNAVRQQHRSEQRRRTREQTVAADAEWFVRPEDSVQSDERVRRIEQAVAGLPETQREIVVLRIWGELTFPQIGRTLSISSNTAASRFRYAVERLRHVLEPEHEPVRTSRD